MSMMGSHQQQTFQGMYSSSGGAGSVLVDTNLNQMQQQQYPMSMSMHMGMMPYGVPVQVPYQNNNQQLQSGQRNFDFKENGQRHNTSDDRFRIGSANEGQSMNAGGDIGNFSSKEREKSQNNQGQQQSSYGYENQEGKTGSDANWGGGSNSNGRNTSNDKNTFQTNGSTAEFTQQHQQYPAYGTSSNMQSHQFIQQQPAYRSKVQSNQIIAQLQQQQYSYQQQPV
jgi:hypothetical protein